MYRLSQSESFGGPEHIHRQTYEILNRDSARARLFAGAAFSDPAIFVSLVAALNPPYYLLYILHTPRGEGQEGRYMSPELTLDEVKEFVRDFSSYLRSDGRFDLWAYSISEGATIVWDRHNYLFGYGPIDRLATAIETLGYEPGEVDRVAATTHTHYYRPECDQDAERLLSTFDWYRTPLRPEDEQ